MTEQPHLDIETDGSAPRPIRVLRVHPTQFSYVGEADPSAPGGIAAIYKDLVDDDTRTAQVAGDVAEALARGRHCLVLTQWTRHLDRLARALRDGGREPVILRGGMGAKARAAALLRLQPEPEGPPLLVVATGPYIGEGFDCPVLDPVPRRAGRLQRPPCPVRRQDPSFLPRQDHRRDSRLPRRAHRRACRIARQTSARLYQPRFP